MEKLNLNKLKTKGIDMYDFKVIKKSFSKIGKEVSRGADAVADILLDSGKGKNTKVKRLRQETGFIFQQIKDSLKTIRLKEILRGAAYKTGKFSRIMSEFCSDFFNDLTK